MASATEEIVCSTLARLLDVPTVTRQDSFFDLGGDSLSAVELMEAVEQELQISFPFPTLLATGDLDQVITECDALVEARV